MPKIALDKSGAIAKNSKSVSETQSFHQGAIRVDLSEREPDNLRRQKTIGSRGISKLNEADASVKSVAQPYESF